MPKIVYSRAGCQGFFVCAAADPDTWYDDRGAAKADLVGATPVAAGLFALEIDEDRLGEAVTAAQGCPAAAIQVLDDGGNVIAGPKAMAIQH